MTNTASEWKNMYVWMWNVPKEYNEKFIPMTQINDSVWSFTANIDLEDCYSNISANKWLDVRDE